MLWLLLLLLLFIVCCCLVFGARSSKISDLGFRRGPNVIVPVWTLVSPLRTKEVGVLLPPNVACRCAGLRGVWGYTVVC